MGRLINLCIVAATFVMAAACAPASDSESVNRYTCNFEGESWDALVDNALNSDKIEGGVRTYTWHDSESDLSGAVVEPFAGYWEGAAISSFCDKEPDDAILHKIQLYAYVDAPYSGKNFLVCNGFMSGYVELQFESKRSYIESVMVANTTYSRIATGNGYRTAERPLGENESIWIEARGYINDSEEVQATAKFFLYEKGKPSFEGWKKWYMTSMCKVDRIEFHICWDGTLEYNPYPAYFALDDIVVVRQEAMEE